MIYDEKTLQYIKDLGEKVDLTTVQEFTPEQQNFLRATLKQETLAALDEGLALAAQMIRESPPGLARDQLANLIESCIGDETYLLTTLLRVMRVSRGT